MTRVACKTVVRPHEERFSFGSMPSSFLEETSHVDVAVRRVSQVGDVVVQPRSLLDNA